MSPALCHTKEGALGLAQRLHALVYFSPVYDAWIVVHERRHGLTPVADFRRAGCLGVAAVVCGLPERERVSGGLCFDSRVALGLTSEDENALATMNDDKGKRFRTIAKHIHLPALDVT